VLARRADDGAAGKRQQSASAILAQLGHGPSYTGGHQWFRRMPEQVGHQKVMQNWVVADRRRPKFVDPFSVGTYHAPAIDAVFSIRKPDRIHLETCTLKFTGECARVKIRHVRMMSKNPRSEAGPSSGLCFNEGTR
jgi:hypothetical protein